MDEFCPNFNLLSQTGQNTRIKVTKVLQSRKINYLTDSLNSSTILKKTPFYQILATLAAFALLSPRLLAQEETRISATSPLDESTTNVVSTLDPVVVTASGLEEKPLDTAFWVDELDSEDVVKRSARTLPDLLSELPGVYIQKTSYGQGSPFIRGFTGYHNLLLVDGVRLNNAAFRSGPNQYWNTIDAQSLASAELVRNQGSVLYGSDAVGGTLQVFSKGPAYAESGSLTAGKVYGRYATAEQSYLGRVEGSVSEAGKYGFYLGGTWKDFGDIRAAGLGELPHTGYGEWDIDTKFEAWLNPDHKLTLYHQQVHLDDAWRTHRTIYGKSWLGTSVGSEKVHSFDQDRWLTYLKLEGILDNAWADDYSFTLSHHRQSEDRDRVRKDDRFDFEGFDIDSYGAALDLTKDLQWTAAAYGVSYYQDRASTYSDRYNADGSFNKSAIQGPVGDDGIYHLASAYVNTITPLGPKVDADLGARYTFAKADIGHVEEVGTGNDISIQDTWNNVVGSARLVYKPDDRIRLFSGVSQAFRAPNFSDLSRLDANRSNEIETPSPGLDPEKFITYELGVRGDWDYARGEVSYYYTQIRSIILRAPTGAIVDDLFEVTKKNSEGGHVHGVDFHGEFDVCDTVSLFGGFGWMDGVVNGYPTSEPRTEEEPMSRLMPTQGFVGVRWAPCEKLNLEALVHIADRQDRLSASDLLDTQRFITDGTPGYTTATFRAVWTPVDRLLITAGVENAFDEAYRIHGSGQNEPGVNFIFGLEKSF